MRAAEFGPSRRPRLYHLRREDTVNFHPDDFLSLIEEVEDQGGVHLATDTCKPDTFRLNYPIDEDEPSGAKRNRKFQTVGCHRKALFLVPLSDERNFLSEEEIATNPGLDFDDSKHPVLMMSDEQTPALAKVCAVDDSMGLWPRFQSAMLTGESFEPYE